MKALADQPVRGGVRVQRIGQRQVRVVRGAIQRAAIEVMDVRIGPGPLRDDPLQLLADDTQRQLALAPLGVVAHRPEQQSALLHGLAIEHGRSWRRFVDWAPGRRDHQQRRGPVPPFADRVKKAVHGRPERTHAHQVGVDEVDAELQADQVRRQVADRARRERVEQGIAAKAQIEQVDTGQTGSHRRPDAGRVGRIRALAD